MRKQLCPRGAGGEDELVAWNQRLRDDVDARRGEKLRYENRGDRVHRGHDRRLEDAKRTLELALRQLRRMKG